MLLDECFCSYHSLQHHQNLSQKLQQLNVNVRCQHQDNQEQKNINSPNGGKKRNFSLTKENDTMNNNFVQFEKNIEHKTKRSKSNECESQVNMEVQMNNPHDVKAAKETRSNQCLRCLNGEPGHINHISSGNVIAMEE